MKALGSIMGVKKKVTNQQQLPIANMGTPVAPTPDDEEIRKRRERQLASRYATGRASTVLRPNSGTLG